MRRFLLAWRQHFATKLKAYVINYADDLVILCRGTAEKAKEAAEKIIMGMKLRLNQEKTRVVNAWQQPFDFLGYTFGPCYAARFPAVYLGARPSKTRIGRLYGEVREHLSPNNTDPREDVIAKLNSMLTGWAQYFSYGTLSNAYRTVDWLTVNRLRRWLCRRHKVQGRGTRQFPTNKLYQEYGLLWLAKRLATQRSNA